MNMKSLSRLLVLCLLSSGSALADSTPGQITKWDAIGGLTDSVITEDGTGNIGVGTRIPQNLLHVGPGTSSINPSRVNAVIASNSSDSGIAIAQNNGVNLMLQAAGVGGYIGTTSNHPLVWRTNDQDRMAIDANGNVTVHTGKVGIGTTSPEARLEVSTISGDAVVGVVGFGGGGRGVFGRANYAWPGVEGISGFGPGVRGESTDGPGVVGLGRNNGGGVEGYSGHPNWAAIRAHSYGDSSENAGLSVSGTFYASGIKAAIVPRPDGQHILLYAEESTEVWFSDYGSVQLADGHAEVKIDPEFLQTVDTNRKYHVFLTANGNPMGSLYVDHRTPDSFEIRETTGTANIEVSYRVVAKRKNFADERLRKVSPP